LVPNDTYPQHVVTAVIVAHDGAAWLPRVIQALLEQTRPVQRVVAVDTGSRDRSGSVLASLLGSGVVFGMDRATGYGMAVRRALQHRAANVSVPGPAGQPAERVEWVWLLHDDCEPAPDALEQLLRGSAETRAAAVLGPKVMDWSDRQVILEAGVTIDTVGRRITDIEPREVDQGQHDGDRDTLAVGSAGMLVRRDVWDSLGGFDTGMTLFRDDVDFCWRVHAAGHRVRVVTDAVVYHMEASTRRKRPVSVSRRPSKLDRRNAILTLAGNLPAGPMAAAVADNLVVSTLRILFYLVAKRVPAAMDELAAIGSVVCHPLRLAALRRRRAHGRRGAYARLRRDLPPGRSMRRIAELVAAARSGSARSDGASERHASDDPENSDFLLNDTGLAQRILTSPAVLLFTGLTLISLVAERSLLGPGPLGGGALMPAWGGSAGLWHEYFQGFHPVGVGSGTSTPPYLAIIALLATVLAGKPWLAVDVILLGCVPLAGLSAFLAARRVTTSVPVRAWAAASYALLPVAMGTIAAGRIGTAVVFVLAPAIAVLAGRMLTLPPRRARRAAWATALTLTVAGAFVPLVWVIAVVAAVALAVARPAGWRNLAIVAVVPPLLLLPWTAQVATNPSELLVDAGLQQPGLTVHDLPARSLLLLSPGGPGMPPVWVTAGIVLAALAALLISKRRSLMMVGWGVALSGLLVAVAVSRAVVTPASGGPAVSVWPGVALLIPALGLLLAGITAGDALARSLARRRSGRGSPAANARHAPLRRFAAVLLVGAAFSAPALAAASWVARGVQGPVTRVSGPVVPPVVGASASSDLQLRTLVLRSAGGQVSYSLQRGDSPEIGDADLVPSPAAQRALTTAVAALVAQNGGEAVDQGQLLAQLDIGFVLIPSPVNQDLARLLDSVAGLRPVSATPAFYLWRLQDPTAEVVVLEHGGNAVTVPAGQAGVSDVAAPKTGGTIELAEPTGGWDATLNGQPLTSVASPAGSWAQAFQLPAGGGVLDISHPQTSRDVILLMEFLAVAAVAVLALPGARSAAEQEVAQPAAAAHAGRRKAASASAGDEEAGAETQRGRRGRGEVAAAAGMTAPGHRRDHRAPIRPRQDQGAGAGVLGPLGASAGGWPEESAPGAVGASAGAWPGAGAASGSRGHRAGPGPSRRERRAASGPRRDRAAAHRAGEGSAGEWRADEAPTGVWPGGEGPSAAWPAVEGPAAAWSASEGPTGVWPSGEGPTAAWSASEGPTGVWPGGEGPAAARSASEGPTGVWPPDERPTGAWPSDGESEGQRGTSQWPASDWSTAVTEAPSSSGVAGGPQGRGAPPRPGEVPDRRTGPRGGRSRRQPARWTPPTHEERWPEDQGDRWPPGQQGDWPSAQQSRGLPGRGSDMLAPLPPPGPAGRHGRRNEPEQEDDDAASSARWPVPDYDQGADQW
jgi:GT2 family glycosyltransferase